MNFFLHKFLLGFENKLGPIKAHIKFQSPTKPSIHAFLFRVETVPPANSWKFFKEPRIKQKQNASGNCTFCDRSKANRILDCDSELWAIRAWIECKQRTSSLEAPIMLLSGHQSAIYTMKFNPAGTIVASGSHDRDIFLWNVHGDCKNFMVLRGHKNAVLDVQWTTDGSQIISTGPDKTLRAWDVETGKQIKKMIGHLFVVNSCCPARRGPPLIVSGSDDGTAKLWDMRQRGSIQSFPDKYQITAVSFSDASDKIYTGGIGNDVKVWDLRRTDPVMKLQGHQDMITGMQLSPDGSYLLTNSMDCSLRIWDMRPYAPQNRCVKILEGHQHNFEKNSLRCSWSPDGSKVTAGSSDCMVYIWDTTSRRILYKLPGHTGSVNECVFHPNESIIGSCSSDKRVYLGEI